MQSPSSRQKEAAKKKGKIAKMQIRMCDTLQHRWGGARLVVEAGKANRQWSMVIGGGHATTKLSHIIMLLDDKTERKRVQTRQRRKQRHHSDDLIVCGRLDIWLSKPRDGRDTVQTRGQSFGKDAMIWHSGKGTDQV
jgi:hypothetical protein